MRVDGFSAKSTAEGFRAAGVSSRCRVRSLPAANGYFVVEFVAGASDIVNGFLAVFFYFFADVLTSHSL